MKKSLSEAKLWPLLFSVLCGSLALLALTYLPYFRAAEPAGIVLFAIFVSIVAWCQTEKRWLHNAISTVLILLGCSALVVGLYYGGSLGWDRSGTWHFWWLDSFVSQCFFGGVGAILGLCLGCYACIVGWRVKDWLLQATFGSVAQTLLPDTVRMRFLFWVHCTEAALYRLKAMPCRGGDLYECQSIIDWGLTLFGRRLIVYRIRKGLRRTVYAALFPFIFPCMVAVNWNHTPGTQTPRRLVPHPHPADLHRSGPPEDDDGQLA